MKRIIASFLAMLLIIALPGTQAVAKPRGGKASPAAAAIKANANNNVALKAAISEQLRTRSEHRNIITEKQKTRLQQNPQNIDPKKIREAEKSKPKIKQEIREKLALQNQVQNNYKKPNFSDINQHWGAKSIEKLAALGIINGYPDGSFKPEGQITQAEVLSLIMRIADAEVSDNDTEQIDNEVNDTEQNDLEINENDAALQENPENTDTSEEENLSTVPDWAKNAARIAAQHKIINLARFHSHVQATRAQTVVWLAKALGLEPADTSNIPFKDGILISEEDLGYIIALHNLGIIKGTPDGKFNPNSHITRAEIAAIIDRILEKSTTDDSSEDNNTITDNDETAVENPSDNTINEGSSNESDSNINENSSADTANSTNNTNPDESSETTGVDLTETPST
ncbi:S-layer homology domain-containing protein [Thermosyntropha sp.]|uniref:S-layer homology domain-containing protein n=1 Tax=Thermosyntropha sp. TaxID=2740820 RepID=UPI0025EC36D9|nr:S-layer homology domain-containing protein [Thermosyntropha sp.]MBO8159888.1 S-layer homology domain-containing protein [Thermosyntropha sp.]